MPTDSSATYRDQGVKALLLPLGALEGPDGPADLLQSLGDGGSVNVKLAGLPLHLGEQFLILGDPEDRQNQVLVDALVLCRPTHTTPKNDASEDVRMPRTKEAAKFLQTSLRNENRVSRKKKQLENLSLFRSLSQNPSPLAFARPYPNTATVFDSRIALKKHIPTHWQESESLTHHQEIPRENSALVG